VNVGSVENPVLVPQEVVAGDGSEVERLWYERLAGGSIIVPDEILGMLLKKGDDAKKS